jgi:hypothetical protein
MAMLSSPLAAMGPPPCPPSNWGAPGPFGRDISISVDDAVATRSRAPSRNSFGRVALKKSFSLGMAAENGTKAATVSSGTAQDYFAIRNAPVRGSSPTVSLAADLSQNFFIEQSPQLPTPRRSLFTSGIFAKMSKTGEYLLSKC